jgi:hypothetical protein
MLTDACPSWQASCLDVAGAVLVDVLDFATWCLTERSKEAAAILAGSVHRAFPRKRVEHL